MIEKQSAAELVATLQGAEVVFAVWPDGEKSILAGKDILEQISESGQSEHIRVATVYVGGTNEAEVIAGALEAIQHSEMGAPQIETLQHLLDHARNLH